MPAIMVCERLVPAVEMLVTKSAPPAVVAAVKKSRRLGFVIPRAVSVMLVRFMFAPVVTLELPLLQKASAAA